MPEQLYTYMFYKHFPTAQPDNTDMKSITPIILPRPEFLWNKNGRDVFTWRIDQIHPVYGGNKLIKVLPFLLKYNSGNYSGIVSMGGPFSNHLCALAWICSEYGIPFHALVRSYRPDPDNPVIRFLHHSGARVEYVEPGVFRTLRSGKETVENLINSRDFMWIPEGGKSDDAVNHVAKMAREAINDALFDVCLACGTGTTAAGMAQALPGSRIFAFCALKLPETSMNYFPVLPNLHYITDAHWGGFGKWKPDLINFMNLLFETTGIITDPVYTGKLFFAISRQLPVEISEGSLPLLVVHTGGITGNIGFNYLHPGVLHPEFIPNLFA